MKILKTKWYIIRRTTWDIIEVYNGPHKTQQEAMLSYYTVPYGKHIYGQSIERGEKFIENVNVDKRGEWQGK